MCAWGVFLQSGRGLRGGASRLLVHRDTQGGFHGPRAGGGGKDRAGRPARSRHPLRRDGERRADGDGAPLHRLRRAREAASASSRRPKRAREETGGFYVAPTIYDRGPPTPRWRARRCSGPVLGGDRFRQRQGGLRHRQRHRSTASPPASGRQTLNRAHASACGPRAGLVWINGLGCMRHLPPLGGFRQSGFGRDPEPGMRCQICGLKSGHLHLAVGRDPA